MKKGIVVTYLLGMLAVFPMTVQAKVEFTEVYYDPAGTDTGREWIEIHNMADNIADIGGLKLFEEGVNHGLKPVVGTTTLSAGQYAVIADDPAKFMLDWPGYVGTLFDSSFSLKNTGETLILRTKDVDEDLFAYDPIIGAAGDGNSLQKQVSVDGVMTWVAALPTPGAASRITTPVVPSNDAINTPVSTSSQSSVVLEENAPPAPSLETANVLSGAAAMTRVPVEPQIFCKINGKSELFAGVESTFSAQGWGLKKQPLQNARYVWNFGDGQMKEGQYVLHTYTQPGTYELFLETASDVYSATDRLRVMVRVPQLSMAHSPEVIVIENQDDGAVDLFGLKVSQAARPDFVFPEHSIVSGRAAMTIDATRFSQTYAEVARADEAPLTLQYLNGKVVATSTPRVVANKIVPKTTKVVAKPKVASTAAQKISLPENEHQEQMIVLDTTAKDRRLRYYGATIGVLALLAFAWWYLLR